MSTAAIVPPPNSSSVLRHVPRLTARARALLTTMNLHFAGVAALIVLDLYLIAHLVFVWQALGSRDAAAMDSQRAALHSAEVAAIPLRGLDSKLEASNTAADAFYRQRLPYAFSQVLTELGALTTRGSVHLTRVQYAEAPALSGANELTEVRMDASVSGDYRPIVQFLNAVERDRMFFLIGGINLTGQQTGQVNLRIRITTYLRAPGPDEVPGEMPVSDVEVAPAPPDGGAQ